MNHFSMEYLLGVVQGEMNISIFDSRYSDGLVVVMTAETNHAMAIEENFSGGDTDWASVRFPLENLGWFPIVFVKTIDQAIPALQEKLKQIEAMKLDFARWASCVHRIGEIIETEKHMSVLYGLREGDELCDINIAYKKLYLRL